MSSWYLYIEGWLKFKYADKSVAEVRAI